MQRNQLLKTAIAATLGLSAPAVLAATTTPNQPNNSIRFYGSHANTSSQRTALTGTNSNVTLGSPSGVSTASNTSHGGESTGGAVLHYQLPHGFRAIGRLAYMHAQKATAGGTGLNAHGYYVELGFSRLFTGVYGGRQWSLRPAILGGYTNWHTHFGHDHSIRPGGSLKATWGDFGFSFRKQPWREKDVNNKFYVASPFELQGSIKMPLGSTGLTSIKLHGGAIIPDLKLGQEDNISTGYIAGFDATYKPQMRMLQSVNFGAEYIGGLNVHNKYSGETIPVDQEAQLPYDPRHPAQAYREGIQMHIRTKLTNGFGISLDGGYDPSFTSHYKTYYYGSSNGFSSGGYRHMTNTFNHWNIGGSVSYTF